MFDPEAFGAAMGELIREAVEPLHAEITELRKRLAEKPDFSMAIADQVKSAVDALPHPKDGKDCDMGAVTFLVAEAVKAIPAPKDGKDGKDGSNGANGKDGASVTVEDVTPILRELITEAVAAIPAPRDGRNGIDGKDGEKGTDGLGVAGAMIDRDNALQITLTNGEVKNLGVVVGKDGQDGEDGLSLDSFDMDYLPETHEILLKATAAGRSKELRYPAGGIQPAGYWREGTKAVKGEAWTHDGSLWIAIKATPAKPENKPGGDWVLAARKGRDGETVVKNAPQPAGPISLKP